MTHRARKRFGQNFLKDQSILQRIADQLHLRETDRVVEIGPGKGALTQYLLAQVSHIDVIELDRDLIPLLAQQFTDKQLTIYQGDALDFDFRQLSQDPHDLRIVGNLPYNISTPLLFKLFSCIDIIADMHFMLQKEVVERLTAPVGDSHYGRLSVMAQYFCDANYLFTVPPEAFDPAPKVDSAIVSLLPKREKNEIATDFAVLSAVVKEAFTYRRKTLSNALKKYIDANTISALGIDPKLRPQSLSVAEFVRIANQISIK